MGNDYTGVRPVYRWVDGKDGRRDALELHRLELVPLDIELRHVLVSLWRTYDYCYRYARRLEGQREPGAAGWAYREANETANMATIICRDLFGPEGSEHIHSELCVRDEHSCPIFEAGFEHAQDTARDWVSNDGPWYP